jgi:hypothetical protein
MFNVRHLVLAILVASAGCGADSTRPPDLAPVVTGKWRMASFDGLTVPATYAEFLDEPVDDRIVDVVIRLDSALKEFRADSTYVRVYYFTEIQDGEVAFRYLWGDHGRFSIAGRDPAAITLTSEYYENLGAAGQVAATGDIQLIEPLWVGEDPRSTTWVKR